MSEVLNNKETGEGVPAKPTKWDTLKDVPMGTKETGEDRANQYETELTSPTDILEDVRKYMVKDGKIYSKETGQEETDEDTILRIKTSKYIFNEAKAFRDEQSQMFGDRFTDKGPDYYVDKIMDRYGFKDENTEYAEGRLLKDLVDNGTHHQTIGRGDLIGSKYNIFIGKKGDFGKALLKRRLKQHGLEMVDMNVSIDSSTFMKDGYSTVDIKVDTAPITKSEGVAGSPDTFRHPAAEQLSKLEAELAKAQKEGDETAVNGYKAALKMVVERNQLEVSPEEWDKMSKSDKERFYKLKMKEAKILGDRDSFNFWSANLKNHNQ